MGKHLPNEITKKFECAEKIVRLISFKSYFEHYNPLFHNLKILNIFKINDYLCSLFMYRYKYFKKLPKFFNDYFTQNNETHHYNTRNANKLNVRYGRTNYTEHAISNKGVITWNILLDNSQYYVSFNL